MSWSHPVLAVGALIVGALVGWVRGRRPMKLDVTIRHPDNNKEKEDE